jgi:hypothetical protein
LHVKELGLAGTDDVTILDRARDDDRVLVTAVMTSCRCGSPAVTPARRRFLCAPPTGSATQPSTCTPLASLIAQAQQLLPQAVHDARDQELTWTQIDELLSATAATAARRYRNK